MEQNWTKDEFTAYVLLYAAQSNYIETEEESKYILSKVDEKAFNAIPHSPINFSPWANVIIVFLYFINFSSM